MKLSLLSLAGLALSVAQATQPNILFVLTDDQDIELGSLDYLSAVSGKIQGEGEITTSFAFLLAPRHHKD